MHLTHQFRDIVSFSKVSRGNGGNCVGHAIFPCQTLSVKVKEEGAQRLNPLPPSRPTPLEIPFPVPHYFLESIHCILCILRALLASLTCKPNLNHGKLVAIILPIVCSMVALMVIVLIVKHFVHQHRVQYAQKQRKKQADEWKARLKEVGV